MRRSSGLVAGLVAGAGEACGAAAAEGFSAFPLEGLLPSMNIRRTLPNPCHEQEGEDDHESVWHPSGNLWTDETLHAQLLADDRKQVIKEEQPERLGNADGGIHPDT
jgi:hypothetical protein